MNVHEAIEQACSAVGIKPPRAYQNGKWAKTDTLDGKSGKGDGRLIADDLKVTGWNWKTGEKATIWLKDRASLSPVERRQFAERKAKDEQEARRRAEDAARTAQAILQASQPAAHSYLAGKGFPDELAQVVSAEDVRRIGGEYLVPDGARAAIVMPARIGSKITSLQLIWESGAKKFLAGGEIGGSCHRIATGTDTWLCEGFATGLSLRLALKAIGRKDTVLCCFSASNVAQVAKRIEGRCFIAADNDKPMEQFGGLGTGEHYAKAARKPYLLPLAVGMDINDLHVSAGIYAVQRAVQQLIRANRGV